MIKKFVRRVSFFVNTQTNKTRKHIIIPAELNDYVGRLCKMEFDEQTKQLTIQF